ncbi:MAG: ROK family protein [Mesorhizobium sp.]|nr:ROK family protein [Mesorhizobium sp.]MBL8579483.1 ROK family protein [Mesorhizobium sp.]
MSRTAIGVDVGGTKIAAGLVDLDTGRLVDSIEVSTPRNQDSGAVIDAITGCADAIRLKAAGAGLDCRGLGVGLPELIRLDGVPRSRWIADWSDCDLPRELAAFSPVIVESDVRAAALAELRYGHGRILPSFAFLVIGSGLSFAFCEGGAVRRGANGYAIHFASSDLVSIDGATGENSAFNLEAFSSGHGMAEVFQSRTGEQKTAREIVEAEDRPEAAELLDQATEALASYIGQMINMFDPHGVVIGGGLGTSPAYLRRLKAKVPAYIWAEDCRSLTILPSALDASAGIVGAAALHADLSEVD